MIELRNHRRRPCCLARYRHGGYSSVFPMVYLQTTAAAAKTGTGPVVVAAEPNKILKFPVMSDAGKRPHAPRAAGRPKGRPKK